MYKPIDPDELDKLSNEELQIKTMDLIKAGKASMAYQLDPEFKLKVEELEKQLDDYQDSWATEEVRKLYQEVEMNALFKKLEAKYSELRMNLIEAIKASPEVKEFKDIALKIIEVEKAHDQYDPENWIGIEHLI